MNRKLNYGVFLVATLLLGRAAAQPAVDTNTPVAPVAPLAPIIDTNAITNASSSGWLTYTNQATENNLTNLLEVPPGVPPLVGPGGVGQAQVVSALGGLKAFAVPGGALPPEVGRPIPIWGPIDLHPSLQYSFTYATSVQQQPGQPVDTIQQIISASFLFDIGPHWLLAYTPSYNIYSEAGFQDTLDHNLSLRGSTTYGDLQPAAKRQFDLGPAHRNRHPDGGAILRHLRRHLLQRQQRAQRAGRV